MTQGISDRYWQAQARTLPELSARQLALRIVDSEGSYVSESTVFRILKREGLIKPAEIVGFKAGKGYHRKTEGQNELWATDCAHLKVVDWGWPFQWKGLLPYEMPSELEAAIRSFVGYYNYQRYHEGLGNVTPYDAYTGRHLEIIQKRKEAKRKTLQARRGYNGAIREQGISL